MKKLLIVFLVAMLLYLSACSHRTPVGIEPITTDPTAETTRSAVSENSTTEPTVEPTETSPAEIVQLPLPNECAEFSFLSGAGAWRTTLTVNRNGGFTGQFLDSEMGEIGEGYPNGSAYICNFSGTFERIEQVDAYSYKMTLMDLRMEKAVGETWIEDGIRYVASEPYGLNDPMTGQLCTEYLFYLPDTPVDQVSEGFLTWWPYRYTQETEPKTTLSAWGILNVAADYGFFAEE